MLIIYQVLVNVSGVCLIPPWSPRSTVTIRCEQELSLVVSIEAYFILPPGNNVDFGNSSSVVVAVPRIGNHPVLIFCSKFFRVLDERFFSDRWRTKG